MSSYGDATRPRKFGGAAVNGKSWGGVVTHTRRFKVTTTLQPGFEAAVSAYAKRYSIDWNEALERVGSVGLEADGILWRGKD